MNLFAALFSRRVMAAVLGAAALSACTVVVDEPRPLPPTGPGPRVCTREYEPVCARRGPDRRSFPNACEADRAGFRAVYPGQCRGDGGQGGVTPRPPEPPRPPQPEPGFCTSQYEPVCATLHGTERTFPNSCEADRAGFRAVYPGQCRGDGGQGGGTPRPPEPPRPPRPPQPEPAFCSNQYAPVCATRHGATRTFPNACEARAADFRIVDSNGPC
jgi:hypothetical protein